MGVGDGVIIEQPEAVCTCFHGPLDANIAAPAEAEILTAAHQRDGQRGGFEHVFQRGGAVVRGTVIYDPDMLGGLDQLFQGSEAASGLVKAVPVDEDDVGMYCWVQEVLAVKIEWA